MALTDKLVALGDVVREKAGLTEPMTIEEMATAITNLSTGIPASDLVISRNAKYFCQNGEGWFEFVKKHGDKITTQDLMYVQYMFDGCGGLTHIPFALNFADSQYVDWTYFLNNVYALEELPVMNMTKIPNTMKDAISGCDRLKSINIDFNSLDFSPLVSSTTQYEGRCFYDDASLRALPMDYYKQIKKYRTRSKGTSYSPYYYLAYRDKMLDAIYDMPVYTVDNYTSNAFNNAFSNTLRLKDFTFETQEDGTPFVANWKNQTLNLAYNCGYAPNGNEIQYLQNYGNSLQVIYNDETYQLYKNHPDATVQQYAEYSRYNKASAIRTINSLPDVSASGGTNTIKFLGNAGSKTDEGAINTMTEEEIAVATAKGWTVTFL